MKKKIIPFQHFYKSLSKNIDIGKYEVEIDSSGINPLLMADGGDLEFRYKILKILEISLFFCFLF